MGRSSSSSARSLPLMVMAGVVVAGALLWTVWGWNARAALAGTNFYFWFLLCLCGELLRTRASSGLAVTSMAACPHFACLLVLRRPEAMAAVGLASLVANRLIQRRSWVSSAFEAGMMMCVVGLARLVFDTMAADGWRPSTLVAAGHYVPVLVAALTYFAAAFIGRHVWKAVEDGNSLVEFSRGQFGSRSDYFAAGAMLSLGMLLAVQFKLAGALGAVALVLPVMVARHGIGSAGSGRSRQDEAPSRQRQAA